MGSATPDNALAVTQLLSDRCAELGLPVWCLDARGAILQSPESFGPADPWLRSGLLGDLICSAVTASRAGDDAPPIDLIPGCWLVPIVTPVVTAAFVAAYMYSFVFVVGWVGWRRKPG